MKINLMEIVSDWMDDVNDWADKETNKTKRLIKNFIAWFINGFEYGCLIWGNIICVLGLILIPLTKQRLNKKD